jgi:hypothetical protein
LWLVETAIDGQPRGAHIMAIGWPDNLSDISNFRMILSEAKHYRQVSQPPRLPDVH